MNSILEKKLFLFKEHVGLLKTSNNYDVYDPNTKEKILYCRETNLNFLAKFVRIFFRSYKIFAPFEIVIEEMNNKKLLKIKKGFSFAYPIVKIYDENDNIVGFFKKKSIIGSSFDMFDKNEKLVCKLEGTLIGWNFKFRINGNVIGLVTKKWAGVGQEMFTSADNYILEIKDELEKQNPVRLLILASVVCIDMVLKE